MTGKEDDNTRTHVVLSQGTMVHHYRIIDKIGAGGMGEVYLAEDTKLKRRVAVKFLPAHLTANQNVRTRFVREAQTVAKLNHPNIVSIYDVSEYNGRPYYVMELIEGESLHYFAHEKPLPMDTIIEYAIQLCQGLGEAHRAGIVHRDIKCSNIAVDTQGRIRLLDFGLAAHEGEDKITKTGSTLGTVAYMSPEQVSGRDIDHRSDLFSLGVVLYELIAGRTPFRRENEGATLKAIMEDVPEPLTRYKSDVSEKLQQIIFELLEKDREIRYQSAEGVIADLKRLMYDSRPSGYTRTSPTKPKKTGRIAGIAIASVVILVAVVYLVLRSSTVKTATFDEVPMIAVLPFENLGLAEDDYFAVGMTDEITSRLAGIKGLGIISRTSSMKYEAIDKDLKDVGKELGVDYVLEGTVRWSKVGDQPKVRITPRLIRVSDGRHMWGSNYEEELIEVFAVQADIAKKIVDQLGVALVDKEEETLANIPTDNPEAYRLYLRALNSYRHQTGEGSPKEDLDSVIVLDSKFALAYALRSEVYSSQSFAMPHSENAKIARKSAEKALELKPGLPQGHLALGYYYHYVETDYNRALEHLSAAKSELPNDPELLSAISFVYYRQGNIDEAISYSRKATELDPLNAIQHIHLTNRLIHARKYNEALQAVNRAIALEPDKPSHYATKSDLYRSWYGDLDSLMPIALEALKHCDTLEFAKEFWFLSRYTTILPWDSLAKEYIKELHEKDTVNYSQIYSLYRTMNNSEMTGIYADSARDQMKKWYDENPDGPFSNSNYGLLLAYLGECERAVELGQQAKELLSIDECHF